MQFALKDWDRWWSLVPSHQAGACPGVRIDRPAAARRILSRLVLNPANLAVLARCLSADLEPWQPLPPGPRILDRILRRLESRRLALVQGPVKAPKPSGPGREETEWVPIDRKDWRSGDEEAPAVREAEAGIEFAYDHELAQAPIVEVEYEVEAPPGLHSEYEIRADG
ncbi:MAG: hypothetical protein JWP91_2699 [Fibrobacteres bacterium]|nr:hypothetical protein [Fibrobacterota bacterium]